MDQRVSISELQKLEFKQAFEEFDKVRKNWDSIYLSNHNILENNDINLGWKWHNINQGIITSHEINGSESNWRWSS